MPLRVRYTSKKVFLFLLFITLTLLSFAQSGSGGGLLNFKNSTLLSGNAGSDGAVYRFPQVTSEVDALVTIKARSNSQVYLVNIDMKNTGFDKAWQPQVGYGNGTVPGATDWWMEFEMKFVQRNTTTPVTITEFDLSAIDIDGNGALLHEYVSFYGLSSYILESNSMLGITDLFGMVNGVSKLVGKRFDGPTTNFTDIDTSGTTVMTTTRYLSTQVFTVRTGGVSTGRSGASERMYSLYFQAFKYNQPQQSVLPVKLKSFDAKLVSSKALLTWTAVTELNFSHYIVERSFDGKNFSDATMVFASGKDVNDVSYSYNETPGGQSSMVYYRLKMVDIDGSFTYSPVRILKLDQTKNTLAITTYPNPVANELRITIPQQWQDQKVVYDMFTANGKMVKRLVNNRASQTEILYLNDINAGTYIVKLTSGNESAVQQIVKTR